MPSKIPEGETRGWIVRSAVPRIKKTIARSWSVSSGCPAAKCQYRRDSTASRMHETGPRYERYVQRAGGAEVAVMDFDTRRDCQGARPPAAAGRGERHFLHRRQPARLTTLLGGTPVAKLIRVRNARGVTVGGTSAGASILSEHMIAFGDEGSAVISAACGWRRPGTDESRHHRSALSPARPTRAAAHRPRLQSVRRRHRPG